MDDVPDWLRDLAGAVCDRLVPALGGSEPVPIACHTNFAEGVWEVTVFLDRTEIRGGAADGAAADTPFFLDLRGLADAFETVDRFAWQPVAIGEADDLGPHVALEGQIEGHTVWLRVLSTVPRMFGEGRFSALYDS